MLIKLIGSLMESVTNLKRRRALRERSQIQTKVRGSLPAMCGQTVNLSQQVNLHG